MHDLVIIFAFVFGTAIGSFLNVVMLRLPRGEAITGRSHCLRCGRILQAVDLIPLVSFLALRGRCRGCKAPISPRYFITEAATGLLFAWAAARFFPANVFQTVMLGKALLLIAVLQVVFIVDWEHYIILDSVLLTGGIGMLFANLALMAVSRQAVLSWQNPIVGGIAGAALCVLPFWLIWRISGGKWMGFGDVKLALFLGWALGWPAAALGILLAIFMGGITGAVLLLATEKTLKSQVPFGTFLSIGAAAALFYGQPILAWYLSLIGLR